MWIFMFSRKVRGWWEKGGTGNLKQSFSAACSFILHDNGVVFKVFSHSALLTIFVYIHCPFLKHLNFDFPYVTIYNNVFPILTCWYVRTFWYVTIFNAILKNEITGTCHAQKYKRRQWSIIRKLCGGPHTTLLLYVHRKPHMFVYFGALKCYTNCNLVLL